VDTVPRRQGAHANGVINWVVRGAVTHPTSRGPVRCANTRGRDFASSRAEALLHASPTRRARNGAWFLSESKH